MQNILSQKSLWQHLEETGLPIVLYGMGNGADLIIKELEKRNLQFSDTFASDGFVRGQMFHGKKVLSFSEIKQKYENFIILTSFGVHLPQMINFFKELNENFEVYSPTISVSGQKAFEKSFLEKTYENFIEAYELLSDEISKNTFKNILYFKLTGKLDYLFETYCTDEEIFNSIFKLSQEENILDIGAYDGDTIRKFLSFSNETYKSITALEPDPKTFKKLQKKTDGMKNLALLNMGAWSEKRNADFFAKNSRGSAAESASNFKSTCVPFDSIDNLIASPISLIKMDTEGAEENVLLGAKQTILKNHPKLLISAYHKNDDFFVLPKLISSIDKSYKIYLRQSPYIPAWETNLYCV